jgi:Raf kinase inhibitor-like YbhB/YbcL family protein
MQTTMGCHSVREQNKFRRAKLMRLLGLLAVFMLVTALTAAAQAPGGQGGAPAAKPMVMTVTGFADGTDIPVKFTQAGDQTSPAISWTNTPAGTVSFLLHMHDVEGVRNHTTDDQLHWLVWNIPATATGLPEGIPMGAQLQNGAYQISASGLMYRGPGAPAAGPRHHYTFEIFALDTKVDMQPGSDPFETRINVMKAIQGHVLGKAVYVGLFHRPQ